MPTLSNGSELEIWEDTDNQSPDEKSVISRSHECISSLLHRWGSHQRPSSSNRTPPTIVSRSMEPRLTIACANGRTTGRAT